MKVSNTALFGGIIGGVAAWAYFAGNGLLMAAGLVIGVFDIVIVLGLLVAGLTEDVGKQTWLSAAASVRALRNRASLHDLCNVCARHVIDTGTIRVCRACDRIPATVNA